VPRFYGVLALVELGLLVFCLVDCVQTPRASVRTLPKLVWVLLIVVFPLVGSIAWLVAGRAERRGRPPGGRTRGPDDDPDFLRGLG
jgi:hypothetical protein